MKAASPRLRTAVGAFAAIVLVAGVAAALGRGGTEVPVDGALVELAGVATVTHPGGEPQSLSDGDTVRPDDEVEVVSGRIVLHLAGGGEFEGRVTADGVGTRIVVGAEPELVQGDLLLSGRAGLGVSAAGTVVTLRSADGVARVRRGLSVLTGVYRGGAQALHVESGGQERIVPALRQLGIGSLGRPSARPEPYEYSESDPWDQRFLGDAIELSTQLDGMARAFSANVRPGEGHTAAGYELILPELGDERDFDDADVAGSREAGDLLVGAAIALLGRADSFQERWDRLFEFRDDGAEWGLVAMAETVDSVRVLGQVESALVLHSQGPTGPVAAGPTPTAPPATGGSPTSTPTSDTGTGTRPTSPTSQPTTPTSPPTSPTAPTAPTLPPIAPPPTVPEAPDTGIPIIDDVTDTVDDILGGLLGGG